MGHMASSRHGTGGSGTDPDDRRQAGVATSQSRRVVVSDRGFVMTVNR